MQGQAAIICQWWPTTQQSNFHMLLSARSDNIKSIFFIVLQGCEQLAAIMIYYCWSWEGQQWACFLCRIVMSEQLRLNFFTTFCKGASKDEIQLQGHGDDSPPCNNQAFTCCWSQWSHQWAHIARSDDKDTMFMLWYCTTRMTAKRKHKIKPPNKQHVLSDCWSNHDDCKGDEAPVIMNDHDRHHRECNGQKYVMSQGAAITNNGWLWWRRGYQATTNQIFSCIAGESNNCKTRTLPMRWLMIVSYFVLLQEATMILPKQPPTLWLMWINHINNCKGAKRRQCWWHDSHVLSYWKEQWQQ